VLRRSWFPLSAWFVLLMSVATLYASPAHHRGNVNAGIAGLHITHHARWGAGSWATAREHRKTGSGPVAPSQDSSTAPNGDTGSVTTGSPSDPPSGWSLGTAGNWLQQIVDARKSWTASSPSDPATPGPSGNPGPDPQPAGGTGSSLASGGTGGGSGGTGSGGKIASPAGSTPGGGSTGSGSTGGGSGSPGSGGKIASPAGSTPGGGSTGGGGSLTGTSPTPASGGSGSDSGISGVGSAAISGATSGDGSTSTVASGGGPGGASSPPPPPGQFPQTRDPAVWPFAATSPWNYPLGSNARYAPMVTGQGGRWETMWLTDTNSIWIGSPSDPLTSLYRDDRTGSPDYKRVQNVPAAAASFFPRDRSALNGGDTASAWISADHLVAQDFQGTYFDAATRAFHAAYGGLTDIDLKGNGWNQTTMALNNTGADGSTASPGFPYFAGCIRRGELGGGLIPHALAYFTDPSMWNISAPSGTGFVWPATQRDNLEGGQVGTQGNLYFGSLLALLPSFNVNALKTPEARTVAVALQRYGAYTINSAPGWGNQGGIYMDGSVRAEVPGYPEYSGPSNPDDYKNDMMIITRALQVVTNSHHNGQQPVGGVKLDGGDGALLAPLAPPFDR
jgi:hypothetical protein